VEGRIREGVTVQLISYSPVVSDFGTELDSNSSDDRLLAVVRYLTRRAGMAVHLVTGDFGMEVKARSLELPVLPMPEDLRLPPEVPPEAREMKALKAEVETLRGQLAAVVGRAPQPVVMFKTDRGVEAGTQVTLQVPRTPAAEDITAKVGAIAQPLRALLRSCVDHDLCGLQAF
jgi:hypothetical protein